jgi:hypothetical protein
MTRDETLARPAGRELDVAVARALGWTDIRDADGWGHWTGEPPADYHWPTGQECEGELPYFATDIAAAWPLLEHVPGHVGILRCPLPPHSDGTWGCMLGGHFGEANSAPEAICRAFLLAQAGAGGTP